MPAVFFYGQYDVQKRWLACMRITFYPMVFMIIATVFHTTLCILFMMYFEMDISGLALALSIKDFALMIMTMIYSNCSETVRKTIVPFDCQALEDWGEYLKISIPAMIMICSERWAFYVLTFMAGILGVVDLASITVVFSMTVLL